MKKNRFATSIILTVVCLFILSQCVKNSSTTGTPGNTLGTCSGPGCLPVSPPPPLSPPGFHPSSSVNYTVNSVSNAALSDSLISLFNGLGLNLPAVSAALGLNYTLSTNSINFQNISESFDANNLPGVAISVPFNTNSNSSPYNYAFCIFTDGTSYYAPMIVQTAANNFIRYFSLQDGIQTTVSNYSSGTPVIDTVSNVNIMQAVMVTGGGGGKPPSGLNPQCTGQHVMNCFTDVYTNHGWISLFASVASAIVPEVALGMAAACIIKNKCIYLNTVPN